MRALAAAANAEPVANGQGSARRSVEEGEE